MTRFRFSGEFNRIAGDAQLLTIRPRHRQHHIAMKHLRITQAEVERVHDGGRHFGGK